MPVLWKKSWCASLVELAESSEGLEGPRDHRGAKRLLVGAPNERRVGAVALDDDTTDIHSEAWLAADRMTMLHVHDAKDAAGTIIGKS
jgi:hypothetical protein